MRRPIIPTRDDAGRPVLLVLIGVLTLLALGAVATLPQLAQLCVLSALIAYGWARLLAWAVRQDRAERALRRSLVREVQDGLRKLAEFLAQR